jgi:hypothetical protein
VRQSDGCPGRMRTARNLWRALRPHSRRAYNLRVSGAAAERAMGCGGARRWAVRRVRARADAKTDEAAARAAACGGASGRTGDPSSCPAAPTRVARPPARPRCAPRHRPAYNGEAGRVREGRRRRRVGGALNRRRRRLRCAAPERPTGDSNESRGPCGPRAAPRVLPCAAPRGARWRRMLHLGSAPLKRVLRQRTRHPPPVDFGLATVGDRVMLR